MKKEIEKNQKRRKRTPLIIVIIVLALVIFTLAGVVAYMVFHKECPSHGWYDPSAKIGDLTGKTKEEIEAELNKLVDEGMFHISISSVITFMDGESFGEARIINVKDNPYCMRVKITLDSNDEVIYESLGIAPGQYIENIALKRDLPKGQYEATALFTAYTDDDLLYVGQVAAKITIIVVN